MKKIINKIKANENLCKGLKIFKLVLDCLVYGFAIFMILGLIIGQSKIHYDSKAQEKQLIPNEVVTPVKQIGYVDKNGYVLAGPTDFASTDFYYGYWSQTLGGDWTDPYSSGSGSNTMNFGKPICYYSVWDDVDYTDFSTGSRLEVYGFYVSWQRNGDYTNDYNQRYREVKFYVSGIDSQGKQVGSGFQMMLAFYSNNSNQPIGVAMTSFTITGASSVQYTTDRFIDNVIFLGMLNGGPSATDIAYEQGYNQGANDIAQSNNGVFGLISQAFTSVASIFAINILPGLTLGTLLVIPLIVMVIIVLFKMFRG